MFLSDQVSSCSNIKQIAEEYSSDMPPTFVNEQSLNAELDLWSSIMSGLAKSYDNVQDTLKIQVKISFHTFICCYAFCAPFQLRHVKLSVQLVLYEDSKPICVLLWVRKE